MTPMYCQYTKSTSKQIVRIIESWASLQWKVLGHHFTRADLIQEGHMVMDKIKKKYPGRGEDHLLSTLARSLQNKSRDLAAKPDRLPAVSDLSRDDSKLPEAQCEDPCPTFDYPDWLQKVIDFAERADPRQMSAIYGPGGNRYLAAKCDLPADFPVKEMVLRAIG